MLSISLARRGKVPYYHIIVRNARSKRDSALEKLGFFNPLLEYNHPEAIKINLERYNYWRSVGAQPTLRVKNVVRAHDKHSVQNSVQTASIAIA